ncbi:MAG: ribosome small subunit-dependent GTPase A [Roseburia sp.]
MNEIIIRKERKEDYKQTEHMVMRAFWNLHGPGCNEHLLVHKLREADCYLPELSRVAEVNGKIVGTIMYSKAIIKDEDTIHEILTFGPLCVEPLAQSMGVGGKLLHETMKLAKEAGYPGICIFGEPDYYPKHGFLTCDHFGITDWEGNNCAPFMGYELQEGAFAKIQGRFREDEVFENCADEIELEEFDKQFPAYPKLKLSCQWLHEQRLGRISQVQKNSYIIQYWEEEFPAKLKGSFYKEGAEFPVVGDYVTFDFNPYGEARIVTLCERKSLLKRPDETIFKEQVMVSNFDYVFIVSSLNNEYNLNRIARYTSVTLQGNGIPVVILTKADLCENPMPYIKEIEKLSEKVRVHAVSVLTGAGMEELQAYMEAGKTIVLTGSSGVGKSTLLNALAGETRMKTGGIREKDSKGRHTTTYRQLITLENGVTIIDTPGMRELGVCDIEEGIEDTFSDIVELESQCKFRDCAHKSEPGCAIKKALAEGTLSEERWKLYQGLQKESKRGADMRAIAKRRKELKAGKGKF